MLHTPPLSAPSDLQKRKWLLKIPTTFPENQRLRRGQFFFFLLSSRRASRSGQGSSYAHSKKEEKMRHQVSSFLVGKVVDRPLTPLRETTRDENLMVEPGFSNANEPIGAID